MKKTLLYGICIVLMVFCGCSHEEVWYHHDSAGKSVLKVRIENRVDTRTTIGEENRVVWQQNDTIGVFGVGETKSTPFILTSLEDDGTAIFTGDLPQDVAPFLAYYPYRENASLDGNKLSITFPEEYDYTGSTYGPMMAFPSEDGSCTFRHLAGLLKITINDMPAGAKKLVLVQDYWASDLTGRFFVDDITVPDPVLRVSNMFDVPDLVINIPDAMTTGQQTFYVPVPVQTYSMVTVLLKDAGDKTIWYRPIKDLVVERATLLEMPAVDTEAKLTITSHVSGDTIQSYNAIDTITLKGYIENYYRFTGKLSQLTEENRKYEYHPELKGADYLDGAKVSFEMDVALHRGKNIITIYHSGEDVGYNNVDEVSTLILNLEEINEPAEAVDLGLSVKWASYNMGAAEPTDFGWPYVWADNTGTDVSHLDDYEKVTYGDVIISSDAEYDAATYKWGGEWRMPLAEEFAELDQLNKTIEMVDGVRVWRFTASNGNSIILPVGDYWTGITYYDIFGTGIDRSAAYLENNNATDIMYNYGLGWAFRHHRLYIRPVYGPLPPVEN